MASRDEELVTCYLTRGSREALEELVSRNIGRVRGLIYSMVIDHATADDLTQEVFFKAIRSLIDFDRRAEFSTWLYRIAMTTTHTHLGRRSKSPVVFQSELPESESGGATPDQAVLHFELKHEIESALTSLSPKLRAAIVLTSIQGKSSAQAAQIEGCSTATMYGRVHEARKQLKKLLAEHLENE